MADTMEFVKELKALADLWKAGAEEMHKAGRGDARAALRLAAADLEGLIEGWGFTDPFEAEEER